MGDLTEVRESLSRAQKALDAAHERLNALDGVAGKTTALVPRVRDRHRREMLKVGLISSIGTAAIIGLLALAFSKPTTPAPVAITPPPPPIVIAPEPPVSVVIAPPPPVVVTAEPPRLPRPPVARRAPPPAPEMPAPPPPAQKATRVMDPSEIF